MIWHICWSKFIPGFGKNTVPRWRHMISNIGSIFSTSIFTFSFWLSALIEMVFIMLVHHMHFVSLSITLIKRSLIIGLSYFIQGSSFVSDSRLTLFLEECMIPRMEAMMSFLFMAVCYIKVIFMIHFTFIFFLSSFQEWFDICSSLGHPKQS